jgi:hypothetical protein
MHGIKKKLSSLAKDQQRSARNVSPDFTKEGNESWTNYLTKVSDVSSQLDRLRMEMQLEMEEQRDALDEMHGSVQAQPHPDSTPLIDFKYSFFLCLSVCLSVSVHPSIHPSSVYLFIWSSHKQKHKHRHKHRHDRRTHIFRMSLDRSSDTHPSTTTTAACSSTSSRVRQSTCQRTCSRTQSSTFPRKKWTR